MMAPGAATKPVLITGAAQGIGLAIAERLAEGSYLVIVTDVDEANGVRVAETLGNGAEFMALDVTRGDQWDAIVAEVLRRHGRVWGLVNNAGAYATGLIDAMSEAEFRRVLDVDLIGPWLGMRAVLPAMKRARSGSIVNIASVAGLIGSSGASAYSAAKWAVRGMTKTAAKEVGPFGVRVNVVNPGTVNTELFRQAMPKGVSFRELFPEISLDRPAEAREVADAVEFLLSDASAYMTGADLTLDGGWTAGIYTVDRPSAED